ncbi:hypothetical protein B0G83_12272 [Paraburkholderia sp. BL21I4N1]|nr:hypothetical protein B0G83_12272 [Paraburkholderia sp. BL21I4N1]
MMSRVLCPRHGLQANALASPNIAARISARGQFEADQLVRVSFDRPKRSREIWMDRNELADHAHLITYVGKIAHLKDFPTMAAIERSLVHVCARCMDELLVRSGEEPAAPTSLESAFDTAMVAKDANVPERDVVCPIHGVVFKKTTSPQISRAIDSREARPSSRLIKTVLVSSERESVFWFDADFLRNVLGPELDLTSSALRLDDARFRETLMAKSTAVCSVCLHDLLIRNGVEV